MSLVRKYLDLSTGHIPGPAAEAANSGGGVIFVNPHRVERHEYGWLVILHSVEFMDGVKDDKEYAMPEWFLPTWELAKRNECHAVLYDRDGGIHPDLQQYEW